MDASRFPATTKSEWIQLVEKSLKGRSVTDLDWQLEEGIRVSPFATAEDLPEQPAPLRSEPGWEIGEYISSGPPAEMNRRALEALAGGVNAPLFYLRHQPSVSEIAEILQDIHPEFISLNCAPIYPDKDPAVLFRDLVFYLRSKGYDLRKISGSVDFDPFLDWSEPPVPPLIRLLRFVGQYMPNFRVLQVNGNIFSSGFGDVSEELALIVAKGAEYLQMIREHGGEPALAAAHLQFSVTLSQEYFVSIAKLRALRILWANVLDGFGIDTNIRPIIAAHPGMETQAEDEHYNMIRATTIALSAVIGGADQLYILPANITKDGESTVFTRRIARNVQHLMQLESHLDWVADPAAGSYYLEQLTTALGDAAWKHFRQIEAKGGFLAVMEL
jgi:methylmalonyl-CoA mutase